MYREGPIEGVVVKSLHRHEDHRGWLIELFRMDELDAGSHPVMAYASQTLPGMVRGPHEHREQSDLLVFLGPGDFRVCLWDARPTSATFLNRTTFLAGSRRWVSVIVPPGVVHGYKNVSEVPGLVFNCPNRLYAGVGRKEVVDEIRHEEDPQSPYRID
ncbi:MAG TPA: dTDP-4-dehydrorhamnose 3,5-epimerase [Planctomycetaceae bacterium]|nr:dTDP-4-dehydrorhamnose 3,5-epimerase [Planctomycetaceae bacterium]HIQ20334.1 dTDP-4-dehydrorhamnose 3,5-epimerase [Planctomycetota bacterium]